MFSKLTCLRAFDLATSITTVPSFVKILKHLKYVVLNVSGCWRLKSLPKDIKNLINLRHLYYEECESLGYMPSGLGQSKASVVGKDDKKKKKHGRIDELNQLNSLRRSLHIRIHMNSELKASTANLKEKQHL